MATKIDRLGEARMMNYGMEALEKYYQEYLMGYARDSNFEGYDLGEQLTKDRIEKILEAGYMEDDDVEFIKSILPDIENEGIRTDIEEYIEEYIERLMILS